jgi:hypothetical protein
MKTRKSLMAWGMLSPAICMLMLGVSAIAQRPTQPTITTIDAPAAGRRNPLPKGPTAAPTITTFDAPGAGATPGYGTEALAMNPAGAIAGYYVGYDNVVHAYVQTPDGKFTTFDAPGAATSASASPFTPGNSWIDTGAPGTWAAAIDASGVVTGYYVDANYVAHGYLRAPDGTFTSFDVPHAGTGPNQGTFATNMNLEGTIAGFYVDTNNVNHGFVRTRDGAITEFDVPGAGTGPNQGTWLGWAQCISTTGAVDGTYSDSAGVSHGFVRDPYGNITTFEVKDPSGGSTETYGINPAGAIVGMFTDASGIDHGLVRAADGVITVFDVPLQDAVGQHTVSEAIDPSGAVVGFYNDQSKVHHGFLRSADGKFTYFDVPAAGNLSARQGTVPMFINPEHAVIGFYIDSNWVWHGFVRK